MSDPIIDMAIAQCEMVHAQCRHLENLKNLREKISKVHKECSNTLKNTAQKYNRLT